MKSTSTRRLRPGTAVRVWIPYLCEVEGIYRGASDDGESPLGDPYSIWEIGVYGRCAARVGDATALPPPGGKNDIYRLRFLTDRPEIDDVFISPRERIEPLSRGERHRLMGRPSLAGDPRYDPHTGEEVPLAQRRTPLQRFIAEYSISVTELGNRLGLSWVKLEPLIAQRYLTADQATLIALVFDIDVEEQALEPEARADFYDVLEEARGFYESVTDDRPWEEAIAGIGNGVTGSADNADSNTDNASADTVSAIRRVLSPTVYLRALPAPKTESEIPDYDPSIPANSSVADVSPLPQSLKNMPDLD